MIVPYDRALPGSKQDRRRRRGEEPRDMLAPTVLYSLEAEKAVLGCMLAQPAEDAQRVS